MVNCSPVSTLMTMGTKLSREDNENEFDSTQFKVGR